MLDREFLAWVKTQDPDRKVSFYSRNCAMTQFGRFYLGHDHVHGSALSFRDLSQNRKEYVVWNGGETSDGTTGMKISILIRSTTFGEISKKLEEIYDNVQ
jgi:hypothetical protein